MAEVSTPVRAKDNVGDDGKDLGIEPKTGIAEVDIQSSTDNTSQNGQISLVPLRMKLISILLVTAVGFGSHWSSGVTGAMKSTLKKVSHYFSHLDFRLTSFPQELHINNSSFAILEASEDFMKTALILFSGLVTDRIGGASKFPFAMPFHQHIQLILKAPCSTVPPSTLPAPSSSRQPQPSAPTDS